MNGSGQGPLSTRPVQNPTAEAALCLLFALFAACPLIAAGPVDLDDHRRKIQAEENTILLKSVYRPREFQIDLERAKQSLQNGNARVGLAYLQKVLNRPGDAFVPEGKLKKPVGARFLAEQLLAKQAAEVLDFYEEQYGDEAAVLLKQAREKRDLRRLHRVARRFFHTEAGFEATNLLANILWDQGQYHAAAQYWTKLVESATHASRRTPMIFLKAAAALQRSGETERARMMIGHLQADSIDHPAHPKNSLLDLMRFKLTTVTWPCTLDWPLMGGGGTRNEVVLGTTPHLTPQWTHPLIRDDLSSPTRKSVDLLISGWEESQDRTGTSTAIAIHPIVVGSTVLVRDTEFLQAYDLNSGKRLWRYRCSSSLVQWLDDVARTDTRSDVPKSSTPYLSRINVRSAFLENSLVGTISADRERVYCVDAIDLGKRYNNHSHNFHGGRPGEGSLSPYLRNTNRLVAVKVNANRHQQGDARPDWIVGGHETERQFARDDRNNDGAITLVEFSRPVSDFTRLDIDKDKVISRSEIKRLVAEFQAEQQDVGITRNDNGLTGHFFLGPPLPVHGMLFALSEHRGLIYVSALNPENGKILWKQSLGYTDRPIELDLNRYSAACLPAESDGIVVCPTHVGILVGVDAFDGSLRWVYRCADDPDPSVSQYRSSSTLKHFGSASFATAPRITGQHVVYLPGESNFIHCVSLQSGEKQWRMPRGDAETVAGVKDGIVVVIGRHVCRGLSIEDGRELWTVRPGIPAGQGILTEDVYLLPLVSGRVAALSLHDGHEVGLSLMPSSDEPRPLGNLVGAKDTILSVSHSGISAFPQSGALLHRLATATAGKATAPADVVKLAQLEMALGQVEHAQRRLLPLLSFDLQSSERERAEQLVRAILLRQLHDQSASPELLDRLRELARTPRERAHIMMHELQMARIKRDVPQLIGLTNSILALDLKAPLSVSNDNTVVTSPSAVVAQTFKKVREEFASEDLVWLDSEITNLSAKVIQSNNPTDMIGFLKAFPDSPHAGIMRSRLARHYTSTGRFQAAEFSLLTNLSDVNDSIRADASVQLVELWDRLGASRDAARELKRLHRSFKTTTLPNGQTISAYLAEFDKQRHAWQVFEQMTGFDRPVREARIRQTLCPLLSIDPELLKAGKDNRLTFSDRIPRRLRTPEKRSFDLYLMERDDNQHVAVIDRQTGVVNSRFELPARHSYPYMSNHAYVGHFVPVGGAGTMMGVSLLEREQGKPKWNVPFHGKKNSRNLARVGPSGPTFCTFQANRKLCVADPIDGSIIWQHGYMDSRGGLSSDPTAGVIGDDKIMVSFASDRLSYTVYDSRSGQVLRTGRLKSDTKRHRRVFGRMMFFLSSEHNVRRFQIWDPLTDKIVFDRPAYEMFPYRVFVAVTPEQEVAMVTAPNRLQIVNPRTLEVKADVELGQADLHNISSMRVFSDQDRYYVNIQHGEGLSRSRRVDTYVGETFLPVTHMLGDVYAIDKTSQTILWQRWFPQRSFFRFPGFEMPMLISASWVHDRIHSSRHSMAFEVIDGATGETIGSRDNLMMDRLTRFECDPERGEIRLLGPKGVVRISTVSR